MLKLAKKFIILALVLTIGACASKPEQNTDDEFATDSNASSDIGSTSSDEFSEFSTPDSTATNETTTSVSSATDEFAEFDSVSTSAESGTTSANNGTNDEFSQFYDGSQTLPSEQKLDVAVNNQAPSTEVLPQEVSPSGVPLSNITDNSIQPSNDPAETLVATNGIIHINSVKYQSNQAGGTVVISADQPLSFKTRQNSATQQLIVEVENAILPSKLKRTLNTKDMASSIGSVDMYQKANSKVARFVIQLRPNSPEPLVQQEGNSLLIVGAENSNVVQKNKTKRIEEAEQLNINTKFSQEANIDLENDNNVLGNFEVREFLANNSKFYGKKISIETKDLDVRDTLRFLAEEAGINLIIDDNVSGKLSVKLKSVPWDQALALILKAKGLAYTRQGNVLRISAFDQVVKELRTAVGLKRQMESSAPLVVKRFFVGYADVADLEKKIKSLLANDPAKPTGQPNDANTQTGGSRGSVIGDVRTSTLIVTDTQENIDNIAKLIKALDSQPQQVLIEGKVVEASEKFTRTMGVNWSGGGVATAIGKRSGGRLINITPNVSQFANPGGGVLNASMTVGTLDMIGDLTANLSLNERQDKVRVLSAPRITVLSNAEANIDQTTQIMLQTSTTSSATAGGAQTQTFQPYSFGVSLKVKPQISNESTVALDMEIKRSLLGSGAINGSPAIDERKAKTRVIVKNGQTAVIGGVFQTDASNTRVGVPFLKDIPVLGMLFRGEEVNKSKNELIIFLTPKILQNLNSDTGNNTNNFEGFE